MQARDDHSMVKIKQHWESRATLGQEAGTDDLILKKLEIEAIAKYVKDGMEILEVGCGNGITAVELAKRFKVEILGIDYVDKMVQAATTLAAQEPLQGRVNFMVDDVCTLLDSEKRYDLIYSERVLINLKDWATQRKAIQDITDKLRPGGVYVMCESCLEGLERINAFRVLAGLSAIKPPWHNTYFRNAAVQELAIPGVTLEEVDCFSATYYFLSRVVNACLALEEGREPSYDAPVNKLALKLPPLGDMAQVKIWLWRKLDGLAKSPNTGHLPTYDQEVLGGASIG